ncbi:MAG: lysophospholipid acyltransferase family protein [Elusimicrobia bacterium]|nr:lysophospholipid acyltransferase family protein [Elusimicrobiota bacterium]
MKVSGEKNVPDKGGFIFASNHISWYDPPVVGVSIKRELHIMAKEELFDIPVLGSFIKAINTFPVKRGQFDIKSIRFAQTILEKGEGLFMFPEGTRSKDGNFGKALPGVGMLACVAQVPVVPVRVRNTDKLFSFKQIIINIGVPIYPPKNYTKENYQQFSEKVLDEIKKL